MTPKQEKKQRIVLSVAYEKYGKKLHSYAFFRLNNSVISEDMVQETFVKTWKYLVKGGKVELMRSFLYHVLRGLIIDQYRKKKLTSLDALIEKGFEPGEDNSEILMNILDGKLGILLISQLPSKYQKIMRMRYVQELSLEEIALVTGQSKKTLAVQVHRGLTKLKALYIK